MLTITYSVFSIGLDGEYNSANFVNGYRKISHRSKIPLVIVGSLKIIAISTN